MSESPSLPWHVFPPYCPRLVQCVVLSEFDIDRGSVVKFQYPDVTGLDRTYLADAMLPAGSHQRAEDATVFFVPGERLSWFKSSAKGEDEKTEVEDGNAEKDEPLTDEQRLANHSFAFLSVVQTLRDSTVRRGAVVKSLGILTPVGWYESLRPLLSAALGRYLQLDAQLRQRTKTHKNSKSQGSECEDSAQGDEAKKWSEESGVSGNLAASLREVPVDGKCPHCGVPVSSSEEQDGPSPATRCAECQGPLTCADQLLWQFVGNLYSFLNSPALWRSPSSLLQIPRLTPWTVRALHSVRSGCSSRLYYKEVCLCVPDFARTAVFEEGTTSEESTTEQTQSGAPVVLECHGALHALPAPIDPKDKAETLRGDKGTRVVRKFKRDSPTLALRLVVPVYQPPGSVLEASVCSLWEVFRINTVRIYNALLAEKRVLFMGHGLPAVVVAQAVVSACSLISPPFPGVLERAYPYATLTDMSFLHHPGFVAGVTNPLFSQKTEWWDVCCDLKTGQLTYSASYLEELAVASQIDALCVAAPSGKPSVVSMKKNVYTSADKIRGEGLDGHLAGYISAGLGEYKHPARRTITRLINESHSRNGGGTPESPSEKQQPAVVEGDVVHPEMWVQSRVGRIRSECVHAHLLDEELHRQEQFIRSCFYDYSVYLLRLMADQELFPDDNARLAALQVNQGKINSIMRSRQYHRYVSEGFWGGGGLWGGTSVPTPTVPSEQKEPKEEDGGEQEGDAATAGDDTSDGGEGDYVACIANVHSPFGSMDTVIRNHIRCLQVRVLPVVHLLTIFADLAKHVQTPSQIEAFLHYSPTSQEGLHYVACLLLHSNDKVRKYACGFLQRMDMSPVGRLAMSTLPACYLLAYQRLVEQYAQRSRIYGQEIRAREQKSVHTDRVVPDNASMLTIPAGPSSTPNQQLRDATSARKPSEQPPVRLSNQSSQVPMTPSSQPISGDVSSESFDDVDIADPSSTQFRSERNAKRRTLPLRSKGRDTLVALSVHDPNAPHGTTPNPLSKVLRSGSHARLVGTLSSTLTSALHRNGARVGAEGSLDSELRGDSSRSGFEYSATGPSLIESRSSSSCNTISSGYDQSVSSRRPARQPHTPPPPPPGIRNMYDAMTVLMDQGQAKRLLLSDEQRAQWRQGGDEF